MKNHALTAESDVVSQLPNFQALFESLPGLYLVLAADFRIVAASDAYLKATLTHRDEILGRDVFEVFPDNPDDPLATGVRNLSASLERVVRNRASDAMAIQKYYIRRPEADGGGFEERYWSPVNSPVFGTAGDVAYIIHRVEDVTEVVRLRERNIEQERITESLRSQGEKLEAEIYEWAYQLKYANRQLREANAKYQAMFDQGLFAGLMTPDGTVIDANRSSLEACGLKKEEVLGKLFWDTGWWNRSPEIQAWLKAAFAQAVAGQTFRGESTYFVADGSERVVDLAFVPIKDEEGQVVYVVPTGMDITDHKRAEQQRAHEALRESEERLRQSEARFQIFAESGPQMIWAADGQGRSQYLNPRWCEYTGLTPEQTADQDNIRRVIHPDDYQEMMDRWSEAFARSDVFEAEFRLRRAADGVYRWFLCRAMPVKDAEGRVVQWVGANTDIDDQKRAEEQLKESDRRKTQFLALLAHELRNPLAPIRNGVQILRMAQGDEALAGEALAMIERQVGQMVRLVDDLLDVSRITQNKIELRKERIDLATVVHRAVEISRPLVEANSHELTVTLSPEPLFLEADLVRLAQVVSNLLNNSARYTPKGGKIELTVRRQGQEAVIRVRDNGIGIPAEMLPKIFDMFTQADRHEERTQGGLGLGLNLVKSLVQLHGGSVHVASGGQGQGSEFSVCLPLMTLEERGASSGTAGRPKSCSSPRRRILVVDDNRDSTATLALLLKIMGHEVHIAYDGPQALELARAQPLDAVLLDIGLPGMSGNEVARLMRQELPRELLLIAMTGWGQPEDRERSRKAGFDHHLIKPLEPKSLDAILATIPSASLIPQ